MKRRIILIVPLLLAGAIVNIAVAWGCHLRRNPVGNAGTWLPSQDDIVAWQKRAPAGFPGKPAGISEWKGFGTAQTFMFAQQPTATNNTLGDNGGWLQAGWPMLSLEGEIWVNRRGGFVIARNTWALSAVNRWLPIGLIPFGFAVNSVLYAALLMVVLLAIAR